jgi:predicted lipoprotein with Yx(FWY)xxD motif
MRRLITPITFIAPASLAVLAAGCGGGSSSGSSAAAYGAAPAAAKTTTIAARRTTLGTVLVDGKGRTLYLFEKDKPTTSACNGACATVWPPLASARTPLAGHGVLKRKLGSVKRNDGGSEVTYAGHPLYTFAGDAKAGDVRGQGLNQFGAAWYVLKPSGQKVDEDEG